MSTLTTKEFEEKRQELEKLAYSVDLWSGTPMSDAKKDRIQFLFNELERDLRRLDCEYLLAKLAKYKEISAELKTGI